MNAQPLIMDSADEGEESFLLVYLCLFSSILYFLWLGRDRSNYARIPSVGFSGTLTSFVGALRYLYDATGMLQEGYTKCSNGIFRIPTLTQWIVVVAKPKYIEELRKAPDDDLSASEAVQRILQLPLTIDSTLFVEPQLKSLLCTQLTRNLHQSLSEMHMEMVEIVDQLVLPTTDEWKYFDELELMTRACTRVINQVLVGTSLCRNAEFSDLVIAAASGLEGQARKLGYYPAFLRPLVACLFTPFTRIRRRMRILVSNTLKERQEKLVKHGDSFPNDMITWFVSHDPKSEMPLDELVAHILLVNYLAVHPTAKVMSQALQNLAKYPECTQVLRAEVEGIVRREGWCRSALEKMYGLDSFLKETMRLSESTYNISYPQLTMARKSLRPLSFSDGTTIPSNTLLFAGSQLLHTDARYHAPAPRLFKPFRFTTIKRSDSNSVSSASQFSPSKITVPAPAQVSSTLPATSPTFLAWGHGKHACPGRFFASAVMKLLLAHFVLGFEFRIPPPTMSATEPVSTESRNGRNCESDEDVKVEKVLWIEVRRRRGKGSDLSR